MTMLTRKSSSADSCDEKYDYGLSTLTDICENVDSISGHGNLPIKENTMPEQSSTGDKSLNFIGFTTCTITGKSGAKGFVVSTRHKPSDKLVAVKRYTLEEQYDHDTTSRTSQEIFNEDITLIMQEVIKMKQIRHPNILPALSSFVVNYDICIVTPLMRMGSARDVLDSHFPEGLPENIIAYIIRDVLAALAHLHSKSIIHRSIRASHILLDAEKHMVKLSGLRYACNLQDPPGQGLQERYDYPIHVVTTNLNWLSPEILQQNLCGYNEKSDIYSLAVTACELANGLVPFSEMPGTLMLLEKLRGAAPKLLDQSTYEMDNADILTDDAKSRNEETGLLPQESGNTLSASQKPEDSGVGFSVGSSYNMTGAASSQMSQAGTLQALSTRASLYANRVFSETFHDFVSDSSILEPTDRPSAYELLNSHPFIRQLSRKSVGEKLKNHPESNIYAFWLSIKDKQTEQSRHEAPTNVYKLQCGKQESSRNLSNDFEWIF